MCRVFLTHCQLGMVIYCSLTLVVLTHCVTRTTGGSLQTVPLLYKHSGKRQTLSFLWPLLGTLHTSIVLSTNEYWVGLYAGNNLHTDQLNIHYKATHPQYNILQINIHKPVTFSVCLIPHKLYVVCHKANEGTCLHICTHWIGLRCKIVYKIVYWLFNCVRYCNFSFFNVLYWCVTVMS